MIFGQLVLTQLREQRFGVVGDRGGFENGRGRISVPAGARREDGDDIPEVLAVDERGFAEDGGRFGFEGGLPERGELLARVPIMADAAVACAGAGGGVGRSSVGIHDGDPDEEDADVALRELIEHGLHCRGPLQTFDSSGGEEGDDAGLVSRGVEGLLESVEIETGDGEIARGCGWGGGYGSGKELGGGLREEEEGEGGGERDPEDRLGDGGAAFAVLLRVEPVEAEGEDGERSTHQIGAGVGEPGRRGAEGSGGEDRGQGQTAGGGESDAAEGGEGRVERRSGIGHGERWSRRVRKD